MPAINHQGVVRRVFRVGKTTSQVQLLTDPNIGIAGMLDANRENGIVHASSRGTLRLDGIPITAEVII